LPLIALASHDALMDKRAMKSTVEEIRARFDQEVERFSNLETGQSATVDAPLALELIQKAAAKVCPKATRLLDIGCGAGNYSLKLLEVLPNLDVTLIDLSKPMLERAKERLGGKTQGTIRAMQEDVRHVDLGVEQFDVIVAAAVLHHLRSDEEWKAVFAKLWHALAPGGALWVSDLVEHAIPGVQQLMWEQYGEYLAALKGPEYREHVYAYVAREDTPRSVLFQVDLMREVGFAKVEILHKRNCFAVFGGIKSTR
jgi:tRNA (cmo5U34)-methyltransferase